MNNEDQRKFVDELIENVRNDIQNKISKNCNNIEEWDGKELRQYIAEKFADVVIKGTLTGKRKKEYNNTILIYNM